MEDLHGGGTVLAPLDARDQFDLSNPLAEVPAEELEATEVCSDLRRGKT